MNDSNLPPGVSEQDVNRYQDGPVPDLQESFADHFLDWEGDYFMDYIEHDVYAYQELIALMGEAGKELPSDPEKLSMNQGEILTELGRSQSEWWTKFEAWALDRYISRHEA